MRKSSSFSVWIEAFAALKNGPDDGDTVPGKGDKRRSVVFSLPALSAVEGLGEWVLRRDSPEGALVEGAFERLVAHAGEELCREHRPHPRQRTDEGTVRVGDQQCLKVSVDPVDLAARLQRSVAPDLDAVQMRGLAQMDDHAGFSGAADLGWRDEARQQRLRPLADEIERPFEAGMDAAQEPPKAWRHPARLVLDQFATATDLEPERGERIVIRQDGVQVAGLQEIADCAYIARVGLAFAPGKALSGTIYGDARRVNKREALGQKDHFEEAGKRARHIETDHHLFAEPAQVGHQGVDSDGHCLVLDFGRVTPDANSHGLPSPLASDRMPRLAGIALQSHLGHHVISSRSRAAMRAAKPPKTLRAASMTAIPPSPVRPKLPTSEHAMKRDKAA